MPNAPTTTHLQMLLQTLDRLAKAVADNETDWDAPEFEDAAEDRAVILDRVVSLRERVEAALVRRRPALLSTPKIDAVGTLLFGQTPEERVRRAEREQLKPAEPWESYTVPMDDHPVGCGAPTELVRHALANTSLDRRAS